MNSVYSISWRWFTSSSKEINYFKSLGIKKGDAVTVENALFLPTVYYFNTSFYKNHVYFLSDFTEALASSHGLAYYGKSISVDTVKKYVTNTISAEFLPDYLQ